MRLRILTTFLLLLWLPLTAAALEVPRVTGYVNDRADMISPAVELKIEQFLASFERSDSTQLVVLTLPTLEGESLEEYALRVAEAWGIGQKGKDNGALLLIARDDRKMRIEVGYGLEGVLTDLLSGRIIDREITPRFRAGDYEGGIVAGVSAMAEAVRGEYTGTGSTSKKKRNPWGTLALLLFLGPGMMFLGGGKSHRRSGIFFGGPFMGGGFGGGGGGGGFSGGGGGFGGGGASGGW